jgi:glycerate 2-kinase
MIPRTVLIASDALDGLSAERVASAIARGISARGWPTDLCPIVREDDLRELLEELGFDRRMRQARAVGLAAWRLADPTPAAGHTFAFEIATRARQAGVPAYAVTAENKLDPFDARILDLQLILPASGARALTAAGRRLAGLL